MFNAAVKNMEEEYETYIESFYDDSDFKGYLNKDELRKIADTILINYITWVRSCFLCPVPK